MGQEHIAVAARVTGRVQGVWFRAWTQQRARELGLTGWVRNEPDGAVSALVCGPRQAVEAMIEALWQGPESARVDAVETEASTAAVPADFSIRR